MRRLACEKTKLTFFAGACERREISRIFQDIDLCSLLVVLEYESDEIQSVQVELDWRIDFVESRTVPEAPSWSTTEKRLVNAHLWLKIEERIEILECGLQIFDSYSLQNKVHLDERLHFSRI